jgi:hypothetical protein
LALSGQFTVDLLHSEIEQVRIKTENPAGREASTRLSLWQNAKQSAQIKKIRNKIEFFQPESVR